MRRPDSIFREMSESLIRSPINHRFDRLTSSYYPSFDGDGSTCF
jgi:hypothetical protein